MAVSMLGFSARMAAGKTTVSTAVAQAMYSKRISFGGVVREEAFTRGISETREKLQELGQDLVQEDVSAFCQRVLLRAGWNPGDSIVVDGVRHVSVLLTLREIVEPKYFALMYLNVDRATQLERWKSEDLAYSKSLEELEHHPTEIEVLEKLPEFADLVLDGKHSVSKIVADVIRWTASSPMLGQHWDRKNERRLDLAARLAQGTQTPQELEEFEILQSSFTQYLAVRYDPFQYAENKHQRKLEELEARLRPDGK